jgi:hypothetical protein
MRFSLLQKYILLTCLAHGGRLDRDSILDFYRKNQTVRATLHAKIITASIERLIEKEMLIGYGVRTPKKWFIKKIKLTVKGKKEAKKLQGEQMSLPFARILKKNS